MGMSFIPLSVPNLKGNEQRYVAEAIEREWVSTAGRYVNEFEEMIAEYVKAAGAVSCQNGTSGIHIALMLAGVEPGDEVIVPTLTFIAAVNPIRYLGASPVFMDCDDSLCMDAGKIESFCETQCELRGGCLVDRRTGAQVKAIVAVHVFGNLADMERIMEVAGKYRLKVIEDATEALGSLYTEGVYAGRFAGTIGDMGIYSFNGNKIITTGGGGMLVSDDKELLGRAKHLTTQAKSDELYYEHDEVGYNYRMTNLQAALGVAQMERLEDFIQIKEKNYQYYREKLEKVEGVFLLDVRDGIRSNRWFYALFCEGGHADRDGLIRFLGSRSIQSRPIWGLIHEQLPYREEFAYEIEKAHIYRDHVVNIPCSTNLTLEDAQRVVDVIAEYVGGKNL